MKLSELYTKLDLVPLNVSDDDRSVDGAYCGDLLSWVMTRLSQNFAWVTIMSNINSIAVASLSDASCIIFTENADVSEDVINRAKEQNVNVFKTSKSTFDISYMIGKMLYAE